MTDLHANRSNNLQTDCLFPWFFQSVRLRCTLSPNRLLVLKLECLTLSWLHKFLCYRQQFIVVNNFSSSLIDISSCVPHCSVLGSLLFLILINDLPHNPTSSMRTFANCIIYLSILSTHNHLAPQTGLEHVNSWCSKWLMALNISKC